MWTKLAGIFGASAVGAGAYGAHGLKSLPSTYENIYKTAANYHLIHSVALAAAAIALKKGRKRNIVCGLFSTGILLFSGSCYTVALMQERKPYSYPAPFGGLALIGGFLAIGFLA